MCVWVGWDGVRWDGVGCSRVVWVGWCGLGWGGVGWGKDRLSGDNLHRMRSS
jgi:hypothetical protein